MNYYRDLVSRHNSIKISEIIPPYEGMIYHYTSVNAFCSILESSKLRFTNKKYLNDTTEGSYIFDLCKREAESLCRKRAEAKEQFLTLCDKIKREKARYNILEAYQCSFSTTSDNLCLWNYYTHGDSVQGYNLGFDSQLLHKSLNTKHSEKSYFQAGKVMLSYDDKQTSTTFSTVAVYAVAVHTDHVHVFLFSAHTAWQLDERGNTGEVLDERYRVIVAF